ncbi:MAG: molecular chaperone HtpG, partial [Pseudonocardia sp.]|nr:molecular chaperone HtpG [Pseudonocardia sp.]
HWESAGEGTYDIAEAPDAPQGTTITLHLKPVDAEDGVADYADERVVRGIVKRYSDFITWPVRIGDDTVNSRKALWSRPQSDVTAEEYTEFYRHVSHDWQEPLETIRLSAEGTFEYQALLFLPSHAPMDLFQRGARRGVQLYVRRVFIMDDCEALVPEYLRFVKGVVDAADLSLNVSREILQQDRQIQLIRKRLVKKVLATIRTMLESEPEKYATFWAGLGAAVKEGLLSDGDNRQAVLEICSFPSTNDADKPTTLRDYVARMPEGQDAVYYMTGESRVALEGSPHMEAFRAKGYEVLLLTDPVDEVWVDMVPEFDGKPLTSIAQGDVDLGGDELDDETRQAFDGLLTWLAGTLEDEVKEVRLSHRLTTSAACLVGDPGDPTPTLEKMYRAMGQMAPKVKRILELNPQSPLVTGLNRAYGERPDDEELRGVARLVHGMALLAEGGDLAEPAAFAAALAAQLERSLS